MGLPGSRWARNFADRPWNRGLPNFSETPLEFDFSPYERSIDLVFVDAAHDYSHRLADSRTALRLVKPGGEAHGTILLHISRPGARDY